jgi:hypothetical protein
MSPQQTLWLCLHNTHCGYVSTTRHSHNVCCGDIATMFVVETWPQCLMWRHGHNVCCGDSHNVCCGDIATMFDVETWPRCLLWRHSHNVCCGDICGFVSTTNIVAMSPQQTLWLCLHIKHCGYVSTTNIVQCLLWRHSHNV